jgi:hypothetical protein
MNDSGIDPAASIRTAVALHVPEPPRPDLHAIKQVAHRQRRTRMLGGAAAAVSVTVVITVIAGALGWALTDQEPVSPTPSPTATGTELVGEGTVIQRDGERAQICSGGVPQSNPPQCGTGVVLADWDWADVDGEERLSNTTWGGGYAVIGTYDGEVFTPTRPPVPGEEYFYPGVSDDPLEPVGTPCPEPPGGGDAEHRPLCVSDRKDQGPESELNAITAELLADRRADMIGLSRSVGNITLTVVSEEDVVQREMDQRFGAGVVDVDVFLRPLP